MKKQNNQNVITKFIALILLLAVSGQTFSMNNEIDGGWRLLSVVSGILEMAKRGVERLNKYASSGFERSEYADKKTIEEWICRDSKIFRNVNKGFNITWIGNTTFLIQMCGINILTDPVFTGLVKDQGIFLEKLPVIDYVVISHNCSDYVEKDVLAKLVEKQPENEPIILGPEGIKKLIFQNGWLFPSKSGYEDKQSYVMEFSCGEFKRDDESSKVKFTFLKSLHSPGGSWMIESKDSKVYFAGDIKYVEYCKKIGGKFSGIDVALLPIASVNTDQVVSVLKNLKAHCIIPINWDCGTYPQDYKFRSIVRSIESSATKESLKIVKKKSTEKPFDPYVKFFAIGEMQKFEHKCGKKLEL